MVNTSPSGEFYLTDGESVVVVNYEGSVASAKCHPDDEFDFGIGFKLAKSRAIEKRAEILRAHAKTLRSVAYNNIRYREKA